MFPKKGNYFPSGSGAGRATSGYQAIISAALRAELGDTHQAIKVVMRWTNANERTVKNWFAAKNVPGGEHLTTLMEHSDGVLDAVLGQAHRPTVIVTMRLAAARAALSRSLRLI